MTSEGGARAVDITITSTRARLTALDGALGSVAVGVGIHCGGSVVPEPPAAASVVTGGRLRHLGGELLLARGRLAVDVRELLRLELALGLSQELLAVAVVRPQRLYEALKNLHLLDFVVSQRFRKNGLGKAE